MAGKWHYAPIIQPNNNRNVLVITKEDNSDEIIAHWNENKKLWFSRGSAMIHDVVVWRDIEQKVCATCIGCELEDDNTGNCENWVNQKVAMITNNVSDERKIEMAVDIFRRCLEINGIQAHTHEDNNVPNVFMDYSGHISGICYRYYLNGWIKEAGYDCYEYLSLEDLTEETYAKVVKDLTNCVSIS